MLYQRQRYFCGERSGAGIRFNSIPIVVARRCLLRRYINKFVKKLTTKTESYCLYLPYEASG